MILPLKRDVVKTYPYGTGALAAALVHEEAWPWFYNSYVNLYANPSSDLLRGNFIDADIQGGECPFIQPIDIPRELLDKKWERFSDFVKDAIDIGYYVALYLNRYYLSDTPEYHLQHFPHRCFLFGYEDGSIYGADFFHKTYSVQAFPYEEIDISYRTYCQTKIQYPLTVPNVTIFRVDLSNSWNFNPELFLHYLKDYYSRTETTGIFLRHPNRAVTKNYIYGMDYYEHMIRLISENIIDMRAIQILYEHKYLMSQRLPFVFNFFQTKDDQLAEQFQALKQKCFMIRNIILRYDLKAAQSPKLAGIVIPRMKALQEEEAILWAELIALLEKQKGIIY